MVRRYTKKRFHPSQKLGAGEEFTLQSRENFKSGYHRHFPAIYHALAGKTHRCLLRGCTLPFGWQAKGSNRVSSRTRDTTYPATASASQISSRFVDSHAINSAPEPMIPRALSPKNSQSVAVTDEQIPVFRIDNNA